MLFKSPSDWTDFKKQHDPDKVVFHGFPREYPCIVKFHMIQGVYEDMFLIFFYPNDAVELLKC